jgi:DNA primase
MNVKEILEDKKINHMGSGRDFVIRCLSPAHADRNPSLRVDKITGVFHCLSCGYRGDLFKYFKINKEKFIDSKAASLLDKIRDIQSCATQPLPLDKVDVQTSYRGLSVSTIRKFRGFTTESLYGMEGRIVFPIADVSGNIYGFQGRMMYSDLEPKYNNYPNKIKLSPFPAKIKGIDSSIILVEGFFDMLNLWDKGLHNTVCTFGTAFGSTKKKTSQKINIESLLQYKYQGIETIYIMYDGDKAGRDAAVNLKYYIDGKFNAEVIELDDGKDPGDMSRQEVKKLMSKLYE